MTTLYKIDSKGKKRFLTISTEGSDLIQESGLIDGKSITHRKTCSGKNIGKSNETSPARQAISEMESKITEKLTEGYSKTLEELITNDTVLPMLAKEYGKEKKKVDWDTAYVQPKLDGMRCLKTQDKLISRTNKVIDTVPHIANQLEFIVDSIDGELYAHGKNFQENMRLIKKNRGEETLQVKYHVYDMILPHPFYSRYTLLKNLVETCEHLILVPTFKVNSEEELIQYHQQFLSEGFEGTMLRHGTEGYKVNGRSSNLLKYKDFQDIQLIIEDIEPAESRPEWGVPVFSINGKKFRAGMKFSHEERKEILTNKQDYIGTMAEIRYFEKSEDGIPRFPVMVGVRLDS